MASPRLVLVTWVDAALHAGWGPYDESASTLSVCYTLGFLMRSTRRDIALAQSINEDGNIDALMVVPRSCVKRIKRLR